MLAGERSRALALPPPRHGSTRWLATLAPALVAAGRARAHRDRRVSASSASEPSLAAPATSSLTSDEPATRTTPTSASPRPAASGSAVEHRRAPVLAQEERLEHDRQERLHRGRDRHDRRRRAALERRHVHDRRRDPDRRARRPPRRPRSGDGRRRSCRRRASSRRSSPRSRSRSRRSRASPCRTGCRGPRTGASPAAESAANTASTAAGPRCASECGGAPHATSATPPMIATVPATSRRPTALVEDPRAEHEHEQQPEREHRLDDDERRLGVGDRLRHDPEQAEREARVSQSGRRRSRASSATRRPSDRGATRASSAWRTIPTLKSTDASSAAASPSYVMAPSSPELDDPRSASPCRRRGRRIPRFTAGASDMVGHPSEAISAGPCPSSLRGPTRDTTWNSTSSPSASTTATASGCTRSGTASSTTRSWSDGPLVKAFEDSLVGLERAAGGRDLELDGIGARRARVLRAARQDRPLPVEHLHGHAARDRSPPARRSSSSTATATTSACRSTTSSGRCAQHKPAAVMVVHIGGHIAFDIDRIAELCRAEGIVLIEDCAHAHGASWNGRKPGTFGDAGIWSFAPTKTISTGEGGLLVSQQRRPDRVRAGVPQLRQARLRPARASTTG